MGDDIKSQVGSTIVHRILTRLFEDRGLAFSTIRYQLNVGGNMDFKNMLERERLESKKISKTQAVTSNRSSTGSVRPRRPHRSFERPRGRGSTIASGPTSASRAGQLRRRAAESSSYKLEVWDSPNSAGVIIDALRCAKVAHGPRHRRPPSGPKSAYFMKSPPVQYRDDVARKLVEAFIDGDNTGVPAAE